GPLNSRVCEHMNQIANALFHYRDCQGRFPRGGNARMVSALRETNLCPCRVDEVNVKGEVIYPWGTPYVYRMPGKLFPDEFDLYSLGPNKKDHQGRESNIVCELHRR